MSDYARIEKVIRFLEKNYLEQPSLEELAKIAGVSDYHFHRMFTKWAGITPKDFTKFLTASHAKKKSWMNPGICFLRPLKVVSQDPEDFTIYLLHWKQ